MERQTKFSAGDIRYLANLCHNCAECYYACQYAPPHEFAVNLPKALAEIRLESYRLYAWPAPLARLFQRNGALAVFVFLLGLITAGSLFRAPSANADFYGVVSHERMVSAFGVVSILACLVFIVGVLRFWRESGRPLRVLALRDSLGDVLRLRYLASGGAGCTYPDEHHSQARRWFHHFTFYGFALCFAATATAAIYHYALGRTAPYGYLSVPVILGTIGGLGLLAGPAGLVWVKARRDPETSDAQQAGMDWSFLILLFATSLTGILLLALRTTRAMPALLAVHLAAVMALFFTLPYGKFVHGIYRWAALVRHRLDQQH
jgi:citrate/tricarballylate utilization protein